MSDVRPPVRVVSPRELDQLRLRAQSGDARLRSGFALPDAPWELSGRRWTCVGAVAGPVDARAALTALVRGVGLAISVTMSGEQRRRFDDDLARAGSPDAADGHIGPVHVALLEALVAGDPLVRAAELAHVSRRTANRRMAEVRSHYGVETTPEAIVRWASDPMRAS
jgi:hypothetical protein